MIGKDSDAYKEMSECLSHLVGGTVLAVDPSSGSHSSQPGWAVYQAGKKISSGCIELVPGKQLALRLRKLAQELGRLYRVYQPDVLVYENIPAQRHGGNASSHSSLLKAVGVILSVPGTQYTVGVYPSSWVGRARESYVKSDENDAIELGYVVIEHARKRLQQEEEAKSRKKRKKEARTN